MNDLIAIVLMAGSCIMFGIGVVVAFTLVFYFGVALFYTLSILAGCILGIITWPFVYAYNKFNSVLAKYSR